MRRISSIWMGGVLWVLVLVASPTSWAQRDGPASPGGDVDPRWAAAAAETGALGPFELAQRFDLEGDVVAVLVGSEGSVGDRLERTVVVVVERPDEPLSVLALPSVQTGDAAVDELLSARVANNLRAGRLLFVTVDTTSAPERPTRRAWIVRLADSSLVYEFEASEWRDDGPEGVTHFEREVRLVGGDAGNLELVMHTNRRNANGRTSRSRTLLRTWE